MAVKKLFLGDSDIDFWDSATVFPGSFNVGVGGYTTTDVKNEVDQWVAELDPEWVVLVVGENDLNGRRRKTKKALKQFQSIVETFIRDGSRVLYLGTKPEPGTNSLHGEYRYYDSKIRRFARQLSEGKTTTTPRFVMIDVYPAFDNIAENEQLYNSDDLHMSRNGYKYWNKWTKKAMESPDPCLIWENGECSELHR